LVILGIVISGGQIVQAQEVYEQAGDIRLKEIGFFSGWGKGSLNKEDEDYEILPLTLRFGFDITRAFRKTATSDFVGFLVEPFINPVLSPDSNVEVGCSLLLKYARSLGDRFSPYIEGGTGVIYTSQDLEQQSTNWNFLLQGGCGLYYFVRENTSLNVGYRFRHFSNAGVERPNGGIDAHCVLIGFSFFY